MRAERAYFKWLVETFCTDPLEDSQLFEHNCLLEQMFRKDYYYTITNDENRAEDGVYLRYLYRLNEDGPTPEGPCSFLEFVIGVGMRLSEILAEGEEMPIFLYFWELATNLGLDVYNDESYGDDSTVFMVDNIMNVVMDRKYDRHGCGGLFPLEHAKINQKRLEVWYQMHAYLFENPGFFREMKV